MIRLGLVHTHPPLIINIKTDGGKVYSFLVLYKIFYIT